MNVLCVLQHDHTSKRLVSVDNDSYHGRRVGRDMDPRTYIEQLVCCYKVVSEIHSYNTDSVKGSEVTIKINNFLKRHNFIGILYVS